MITTNLHKTLDELRALPAETEWLEFKHNNTKPAEIGEYLSAIANGAACIERTAKRKCRRMPRLRPCGSLEKKG